MRLTGREETGKGKRQLRIWFKEWKDSRMLRDLVVSDDGEDTRTNKIFQALEQACSAFDLSVPIWLDKNIDEFKRHAKTRFSADNFVDGIGFDYLEMHVIEE